MELIGIHHLTAISARIRDNLNFYTEVMGMRLVKRSVNQDDVSAYHLFYADAVGTPGTDLTFFDWPVPPERRGTGSIVGTGLRVGSLDSLDWWARRLEAEELDVGTPGERDGRAVLDFQDPEGQRLFLVVDDGQGDDPVTWAESPVPAIHQLRGLGPVILSVPRLEPTHQALTRILGMRPVRDYGHQDERSQVHVYEMGGQGAHAELHVAVQPHLPPARPGAAGVHHVAFRTPDEEEYEGWAQRLNQMGVPNSGPVDRYYFKSLYFREPGGILFEIATDGPGFAVDEDEASLGESVVLPPFLEPQREEIVAGLKPLD